MSEASAPHNLFADVSFKSSLGMLMVRLVGPSIGQRETTIIQQMVAPAISDAGAALRRLVLDLSSVTFMNSTGLGMLVDFRNRTTKAGGSTANVILVGLNAELVELLRIVKFDRLFTIVKNADELSKAIAR